MKVPRRPLIAVDLFCGAGGLTRGLLNAGIAVVLGVDINEEYRRTYEANNSPAQFLAKDIRSLTGDEIREHLPKRQKYQLALVGCAPCQPFSSYRRAPSCSEGRLVIEFARLVEDLEPEWIFMENVPGLPNVPGFSAYRRFTKVLKNGGYSFAPETIDAKHFGVPQTRRRFVVLASRTATATLPGKSHGPGAARYRTVREAIAHLPRLAAGQSSREVPNHQAANIAELNLERLKHTPRDGGSRSAWPLRLTLKCHKRRTGHEDVYGRMKWDAPAPTLTCRCFSISNGRYGHPEQHRAISLREAASLQSFPDDYVFYGNSQRSVGEQIGNAVPVLLAEAIGNQMLSSAVRSNGYGTLPAL